MIDEERASWVEYSPQRRAADDRTLRDWQGFWAQVEALGWRTKHFYIVNGQVGLTLHGPVQQLDLVDELVRKWW